MKIILLIFLCAGVFSSCKQVEKSEDKAEGSPIVGTWRLISNVMITKGDTVVAYPLKGKDQLMLKMYNNSHFSFFNHDLKQGKIPGPVYDSGAGTYKLAGNDYSEHLEFCNYREWENHDFKFKLSIRNDTLVQRGIEKIDSLNVNREIIETYVRLKGN